MLNTRSLPPGKLGLPFVGETRQFASNPTRFAVERYVQYGPIFKSHIFGAPMIFMVGPEALRFVLSTHRQHFSSRQGWPEGLRILMGGSLLLEDGDEHDRTRRMLTPAFHGRALASYAAVMEATTLRYLARWERNREFAWYDELKQLTFEVASQLLLGASPGPKAARLSQLFTAYSNGMSGIHLLFPTRLHWSPFGRALAARDALLRHLEEIIGERQKTPTDDALSLMMQARDEDGCPISLHELTEHAMFLLFAGHESTTSLVTSFCLEMVRHPDVLQRARDEQERLGHSGPLTLEQIEQMEYLNQLVLELERLHPPFTGVFRAAIKPFDFNGFSVPAGWRIFCSIAGTHQIETLYPEPERFDPERFHSLPAQRLRHNFSLVGFGGGVRTCLGIAFARLEARIIATHLLRGYRWKLVPGQRLDPIFLPSPHPKDGLRVSFQRMRTETV